jgi:DNA-directed RNA polymerase subunit H (RpoH/RPB5)
MTFMTAIDKVAWMNAPERVFEQLSKITRVFKLPYKKVKYSNPNSPFEKHGRWDNYGKMVTEKIKNETIEHEMQLLNRKISRYFVLIQQYRIKKLKKPKINFQDPDFRDWETKLGKLI